ncbi:MAG TPA: inner membrane CreD family protein, partial [Shinella sp.]|nr:inner membrane CreD family protein [Shinella sp.]
MTTTEADDPVPASPRHPNVEPRPLATFLRSPGVKFIMIGIISVALLVPLLLVWGLTEERAQRAADVSRRIAHGWGGEQAINGPYLAVPFEVERSRVLEARTVVERVTEWVLVMPETLDVTADLKAEERRLSIYTLPVYNGALTLKGRFAGNILQDLAQFDGTPQLDRAFLVLNINDITGIRSDAGVTIDNGAARPFDPGMRQISAMASTGTDGYASPQTSAGVHRMIERPLLENGFAFEIALSLNGS